MLDLHEHGALVERFDVAKPDYALHADQQAEIIRIQSEHDQAGLKSGSVESIHLTSAAATRDAHDAKDAKAERESKQRAADMMLQALLDQIADLDAQIAAIDKQIELLEAKIKTLNETMEKLQDGELTVDEALSDPEVSDAIKAWEQRTGKKFDPNDPEAADILVAILGSEVDALGNDLASLKRDKGVLGARRDELQAGVDEIVQMQADGAPPEAVIEKAEEISASVEGADLLGSDERVTAEIEEIARNDLNGHRDTDAFSTEASNDEDAFDGFDLGPSDKLASASEGLAEGFKTASAEPMEPPVPSEDVGVDLEFSAKA